MTNQQPAELSQPSIGPLHNPAALVSSEFASVFVPPMFVVLPIGHDQFDTVAAQAFAQRIRIVAAIGNHPLWFLSRGAFGLRNTDLGERGFRKRNFTRRGTFQPNSQRNTFTVDQYHPLRALAPLGFSNRRPPFSPGRSCRRERPHPTSAGPSWSNAPSSVRQACSHTPSFSQCWSRRQQVEGDGNSSGRKRHAAPVWRIHKIPSKQVRLGAGGRPRLSGRCLGGGSKAPTNSYCSSVNSFCRSFMTEAHRLTCLTHKYLM